jgi:hypothetical protein
MLIKKKEEKKLRYEKEWFMSEVNINGKTYYSRDGFSFNHSRHDRLTLDNIVKNLLYANLRILAIENKKGDVCSLVSGFTFIELEVKERVLILNPSIG